MGWNADSEGLSVIFDRDIPPFVREHVGPAVDGVFDNLVVRFNQFEESLML
jgi:predicted naringenin-chalcone synthase